MSLVVLVPLSIGLAASSWALRNGRFDDPEGDAWRILPPESLQPKEGPPDAKLAPDAQDSDPGRRL